MKSILLPREEACRQLPYTKFAHLFYIVYTLLDQVNPHELRQSEITRSSHAGGKDKRLKKSRRMIVCVGKEEKQRAPNNSHCHALYIHTPQIHNLTGISRERQCNPTGELTRRNFLSRPTRYLHTSRIPRPWPWASPGPKTHKPNSTKKRGHDRPKNPPAKEGSAASDLILSPLHYQQPSPGRFLSSN